MSSTDFDDILDTLGLGRWNLFYLLGLSLTNFMTPAFYFQGAFIAPRVNFSCNIEETDNATEYEDDCEYTIWENSTTGSLNETRKCTSWTYEDENFLNTLTSEFNLVCDNAYLRPSFQSVITAGSIIGVPISGFLSDRFGRKRLLICTTAISTISVFLQTITYNFNLLLILRFFSGCTTDAIYHCAFSLCMEVCPLKHRSAIGIISSVPWAFGMAWWGVLGYLIRDWRWLLRATVVPVIFISVWLWIIDESPRWSIVRGRHDEAVKSLRRAAEWNGVSLSSDEELLQRVENIEKALKAEIPARNDDAAYEQSILRRGIRHLRRGLNQVIVLYRTPVIRARILLLYISFIVNSLVYSGITLNAVNYQLDPFIYMIVGGLSEIPAYTLIIPIIAKVGRVRPLVLCYMACASSTLALGLITPDPKWLIMTLVVIGKFCISASFMITILLACELVPTEVRLQGLGTSSALSSCGAITAPFIKELGHNKWIASVIFAVLGFIAGISSAFFPETLNKHMPETIDQLEREEKKKVQPEGIINEAVEMPAQ